MNKLTLKDQFLSLEQAKELQELGVDIYGNFEIDIDDNGFETIEKVGTFASDTFEYYKKSIPTLSVAEMIEMLPEYTSIEHYTGKWHISDNHNSLYPHFERNVLLRNSLFEMLKWLKQNKLI